MICLHLHSFRRISSNDNTAVNLMSRKEELALNVNYCALADTEKSSEGRTFN